MQILFTLDQDEGIDPVDPIGNIIIINNQTTLSAESTYLDSWFDVLINGLKSLQNNSKITFEIVEEPELITFEPVLEGFKISYGKQVLFFYNLNEFSQSLLKSAQDFLSQLVQEPENLSNLSLLSKINHFIEQSMIKQQEKSLHKAIAF